ncbi:hypothetical protein [Agrobacterium rosae]|uniref:Uncharacterized protein n=1 Tax=Agrobacterium rosae TaxID=1972867 RepID=A0AAW9FNS1_9HYPH|nr:hypothetical protein [Agrobacterium rosae]MDX8304540.1 hypothetical protein [Agrobacterium rosae]
MELNRGNSSVDCSCLIGARCGAASRREFATKPFQPALKLRPSSGFQVQEPSGIDFAY